MRKDKGISLIALIITIIVIVILAAVVVSTSLKTPESAKFAKFINDMGEIQQAVTLAYLDRYAVDATTGVEPNQSEIYKEIARGEGTENHIKTEIPNGIEGNEGYRIQDTTKIKGIDKLPDYGSDYYVTDKGIVFLEKGYVVNGNTYYNGTTSTEGGNSGGETPENPNNKTLYIVRYELSDGTKLASDKTVSNQTIGATVTETAAEIEDYIANEASKSITLKESNNEITFIYTVEPLSGKGKWNGTLNTPKLSEGMTPVAWDDSYNEITPTTNDEWYNYEVQTSTTESGGTSRWANAKAVNGSNIAYFVWIPRYEYKITSGYNGQNLEANGAGTIDIKFIPTSQIVASEGYIIHPAFTFDEELLDGIWVGKYKLSTNYNIKSNGTNVETSYSNATNVPDLMSSAESVDRHYGLTGDSHMMKNKEWGAVAYLAHSKYGRNCTKILSTTNTTGNIYGIYDMVSATGEFVAGIYYGLYNTGWTSTVTSIHYTRWKYFDFYKLYSESCIGDATYETTGWFNNLNTFVVEYSHGASNRREEDWFIRGTNGIFAYKGGSGYGSSNSGIGTRVTYIP